MKNTDQAPSPENRAWMQRPWRGRKRDSRNLDQERKDYVQVGCLVSAAGRRRSRRQCLASRVGGAGLEPLRQKQGKEGNRQKKRGLPHVVGRLTVESERDGEEEGKNFGKETSRRVRQGGWRP